MKQLCFNNDFGIKQNVIKCRIADECATESIKLTGSAEWTLSVPAILERHQIPKDMADHYHVIMAINHLLLVIYI